ncbi:MAG: hypothetical protein IJY74_01120, partial [Oscillospiraceae bacterium]|nr:hypothetical protein [Oscillospiraceae bacterium]
MKNHIRLLKKIAAFSTAGCCICNAVPAITASAEAELKTADINYTESVEYDLGSCDSGYTSTPWIR